MCGIAGFIDPGCHPDDAIRVINGMCEVIRHRGPDDQGVWVGDGGALGMTRLSIIDLAGGRQPIFNEDRTVLVVFNGEIYNFRELQGTLRQRGHSFHTDSDTEVIVHAYEEYGDDFVTHLRGMFALAIWDRKRQRLVAARDRFGKKPLNYYWDQDRLIFGSEIKSLLQAGITRAVNPVALDDYLAYGYVPAPNTLFQGVQKLPAGHIFTYEDGQLTTKRYWDLTFTPTCEDDEATAIERTRALLREAVQVRLMSDVPLGAFLSGGIDSSLIVGLMSDMIERPVKTFSIGFEDDGENELPYAREVASYFGTDHHEYVVRPEVTTVLPELVWAFDEPFADSSMVPTFYVSKLARQHVTVALTGDGGDEIFGGYLGYQRELLIDRVPGPIRYVGGRAAKFMPNGMRGKRRLAALGSDLATRSVNVNLFFPFDSRPSLYTPDQYAHVHDYDARERQLRYLRASAELDTAARLQHVDAHVYLTDDILVKVDKASMLNSLETRTPLLDQVLAEYVTSLPSSVRTHGGTLKYLLKKVAADLLPSSVLTRRKHGFSIPLQRWMLTDLAPFAHDLLDSPRAHQRGIFQPESIRSLLETHSQSRLAHSGRLVWALLCLELWFQVYMDVHAMDVSHGKQIALSSRQDT
jgi:asparagine synthase (glutamine-hydrolysing)